MDGFSVNFRDVWLKGFRGTLAHVQVGRAALEGCAPAAGGVLMLKSAMKSLFKEAVTWSCEVSKEKRAKPPFWVTTEQNCSRNVSPVPS